jgi:hypothetical protein
MNMLVLIIQTAPDRDHLERDGTVWNALCV